jgi:ATP-dependent DNA helicase RecG
MFPVTLETSIEFLKGVGPQRAAALNKDLSIFTFNDLLNYFPFRYVDRSKFYLVSELKDESAYVQLRGRINRIELTGDKRIKRLVARFSDSSGQMELVWFQGIKWVKELMIEGGDYIIFGKPKWYKGKLTMPHPELEIFNPTQPNLKAVLQGIYYSTEKLKNLSLDSKGISKLQSNLWNIVSGDLVEIFESPFLKTLGLMNRQDAYRNIHQPESIPHLEQAEKRLKMEELVSLQLRLGKVRNQRVQQVKGIPFAKVGEKFNTFFNDFLPYQLTGAQKKVIREIRIDVGSGKQMNRLLQGDVGSGKTLVALMIMLIGADNGCQACLMAPTEILATQHYKSITELLGNMPVKVGLLTGSSKKAGRKVLLEELAAGEIDILIGTHALIEEVVKFKNLGLVVIDEQHRFGVEQRSKLWSKGENTPHVLVMTATPIPRTLAMTLYGDLEVSVIDELPPGRKPIVTVHRYEDARLEVFEFMKTQIALGRQAYVVYPLIEESEKLDYKDLMDGYDNVSRHFPIPKYQVSVVHGKMKAADKDMEMERFVKGTTQIMVATTVIEVGVNVPNATVMIIESAEKFGLSQLHQLRGRVGRGGDQSYCILMTSHKLSHEARKRINTMVRTNDGFEIADVDLELRGPGSIDGTRQSGILELKLSNLSKDQQLVQKAREVAIQILEDDPSLSLPYNHNLANWMKSGTKGGMDWSRIS